jgi:hypothetical protein
MTQRTRILFIGELNSSHYSNWMAMLAPQINEFEVSGINLGFEKGGGFLPPVHEANSTTPLPGTEYLSLAAQPALQHWAPYSVPSYTVLNETSLKNARKALVDFAPHVVHTLGLFPGGIFYLHMLRCMPDMPKPLWLIQARGGPDIALNRDDDLLRALIREMLQRCDYFLADNDLNYQLAQQLGLTANKISPTGFVPGTGGIDYTVFDGVPLPSQKEPLIVWPKGYFFIQSDGMPVVEALRLAMPRMPQAKVVVTAASIEVSFWLKRFLAEYADRLEVHPRVPYAQMTELLRRARVLLAPSLSDGIPNSMYEAMASHTAPIISPIETLTGLFKDREHALFAPNLDPRTIANALVELMSDDTLVDRIATTNKAWLPELAGKESVRRRVIPFYHACAEQAQERREYILDEIRNQLAQTQAELADARRILNLPAIRVQRAAWKLLKFWK